MVIIRVISGNASVQSLHAALPLQLPSNHCECITPFANDFILSMDSSRAATSVVKKNQITLKTNHGPCTVSFSHWTPEFSSHSIAAGNYNWVRLSNLPLHCWNWDSIVEVLRPLGELIYVQKEEEITLEHLRALVRLKSSTAFPIEMIVDVGVRSFKVKLEDDGVPVLRSKIIQGPVPVAPSPKKSSDSLSLVSSKPLKPQNLHQPAPPSRSTHQIPREDKGKILLELIAAADPFALKSAILVAVFSSPDQLIPPPVKPPPLSIFSPTTGGG